MHDDIAALDVVFQQGERVAAAILKILLDLDFDIRSRQRAAQRVAIVAELVRHAGEKEFDVRHSPPPALWPRPQCGMVGRVRQRRATPVVLLGIRPPCPVQGGFPLFCRGKAAVLNLADARLSPNRGADGAFPRRQAIHGELQPRCDCVRWGRCGVDGQSRVIQSGQNDRMSRGQLIDDGDCYNPTLSCANLHFMLFRMSWIESGSARGPARKGNREGKKFFIWIRCNPLKRPDSTKGIQGNASLFPWFYLDFLGFIWPPSRTRVTRLKPHQPRRRTGRSRRSSPRAGRTAARGGRP